MELGEILQVVSATNLILRSRIVHRASEWWLDSGFKKKAGRHYHVIS